MHDLGLVYRALIQHRDAQPVSLARLRELKNVIERLAAASHLEDLRVYGSVARSDEASESDVDLLITPRLYELVDAASQH